MFEFNASKIISYTDFTDFLRRQKRMFEDKKHELFVLYGIMSPQNWDEAERTYDMFRNRYNTLVQNVIADSIKLFRQHLPPNCLIIEFGSFVKGTERIHSDVDLTICYDSEKTNERECAEELINYAIAHTLGFSIDHVHGKFQHYPEMHQFDGCTEADNHYRLTFGSQSGDLGRECYIDYKCGPGTLRENLMNIKNVRDYRSMLDGYKEKYLKKINIDCLYSVKIIENTTQNDFLADMLALERRYDICGGYKFNFVPACLPNPFEVSSLKKILKNDGIVEFYVFLAKLRKLMQIDSAKSYSMSVNSLRCSRFMLDTFGSEFVRRIFDSLLKLLFYWNRLEMSLLAEGIPLSTRSCVVLSHDDINKILCRTWGDTVDISCVISARNDMIDCVKEGLINAGLYDDNSD